MLNRNGQLEMQPTGQVGMQQSAFTNAQQSNSATPNTITSKDLSFLKDQMSWLLLAVKKCNHYVGECQDEQVKQTIQMVCDTHMRNYRTLLGHCQMHAQGQMASQTQPTQSQNLSM